MRIRIEKHSLGRGGDVGGSSIKCALIDLNTGAFAASDSQHRRRHKIH